jgi:hypothetical protein
MIPLLVREQRWYCPNCRKEDVTREPRPHTRFHVCPRLHGLTAPMLPAGTRAKVEAVERGDYVGTERVQLDPERGRPVQSVVTTRDNGQDCIVFAPVATGSGSAG